MPSFLDFMERATTGPMLPEQEFNRKVLIPNVRKGVKDFNIKYSPENPVPSNDELADRLFEAAIEFLSQTGIYCDSTHRTIHLDRKEILEAVAHVPAAGGAFGEGRDRRHFVARGPEDKFSLTIPAGDEGCRSIPLRIRHLGCKESLPYELVEFVIGLF